MFFLLYEFKIQEGGGKKTKVVQCKICLTDSRHLIKFSSQGSKI